MNADFFICIPCKMCIRHLSCCHVACRIAAVQEEIFLQQNQNIEGEKKYTNSHQEQCGVLQCWSRKKNFCIHQIETEVIGLQRTLLGVRRAD